MGIKLNRIGEKKTNTFGSKMKIINYKNANDIDVYFPEYDWVYKNTSYKAFKKGNIKCPYEKRYRDVGYIGEGKYKPTKDNKHIESYDIWNSMLQRCYDEKRRKSYPTYENCKVCDEWHNFQNFAEWYEKNYYEIEGEKMHLDKDILFKGNKIYSPKTCIFVPEKINYLFTKSDKARGDLPIGVRYCGNKYQARCNNHGESIHLGSYNTIEDAFQIYKEYKENVIKQVADEYKGLIPQKLYMTMYKYKVEVTD